MSNTTTTSSSSSTTSIPTSSTTIPTTSSVTTVPTTTSIISQTPSTTTLPPSTTSSSVVDVTQTITQTPTSTNGSNGPTVVTLTRTEPNTTSTPSASAPSSRSSSASSTPSAISASGKSGGGGLGSGGVIAIAVVIPIVVVILCVLLGLWFWRKRKARKSAEEERKNEMAEYGYNPNSDPTLPVVGAAYTDATSEAGGESGYRGWGTTSSNTRKPSTTLGSNSRNAAMGPVGMAYSDESQPGGYAHHSNGTGQGSDQYTGEQLSHTRSGGGDVVTTLSGAAAGAAAGATARNRNSQSGVQRGSSNASSAYSAGRANSDSSGELPHMPGANYFQEEVPYNVYHDVQPGHGPYGDGTYGGAGEQPVIRDVAARRNTRIERAPTFPQTQGGISQNF